MNITEFLRDNLVREVRFVAATGQWSALLRCGGPSGYGSTVEDAVADAREKNADWLDAPWLKEAA